MRYVKEFFEKLTGLGTALENDLWTNQGIRLINKISVFMIILTFPYAVITYVLGFKLATYIANSAILGYSLIYFINSKGFFGVSRILSLSIGNFHIFLAALVLGNESGVHHYFYAAVIAPLFFFRPEEYRKIFFFVLLSTLMGLCYPYYSEIYHPYSDYKEIIKFYFHIPTISGAFVAVFSFIFYFYTESFRTQKILDEVNKELQTLGETDFLTQIGNRRKFDSVMQMEWNRGLRKEYQVSVILIDVDNFKLFNDTYGHLAGDECLKEIATALSQEIRINFDFIARYGGEEFIVILHDTQLEGAEIVATRMKEAIYNIGILHLHNLNYGRVTISIGVASMIPINFRSPLDLIGYADQCLYEAKTTGKNKFIAKKYN